jgi:hypothetical protein
VDGDGRLGFEFHFLRSEEDELMRTSSFGFLQKHILHSAPVNKDFKAKPFIQLLYIMVSIENSHFELLLSYLKKIR